MDIIQDLFSISDKLVKSSELINENQFSEKLEKLEEACGKISKSWSGSWLGYHSLVYYRNFKSPPPGARFSQEWGFLYDNSSGDWVENNFDDIVNKIYEIAGNPDLAELEKIANEANKAVEEQKIKIISDLTNASSENSSDEFLSDLLSKVKKSKSITMQEFVNYWRPSGQIMSRDMAAVEKGLHTPPHCHVLAQASTLRSPFTTCEKLSKIAQQAASHLSNKIKKDLVNKRIGTNIFIGHGGSKIWKDLKDFIQDRIHLPWDEFNRVPIAGFTNITRLSQMLDEAAIAFLIMTGEDEQKDGKIHARQNVIHEAGLFQGRLGFERAIILLEEGCEEFSNIQGLGQIRFPKGNITAIFEKIRLLLERENLIESKK